jgi:NADPH2:quinone reductase
MNSGDDIAGIVHEIGKNVRKAGEFSVGDRVAAFHPMMSAGGAYAEYAVAPRHTVFKIPENVGFEGMWMLLFALFGWVGRLGTLRERYIN